jgi:hypothetical protein
MKLTKAQEASIQALMDQDGRITPRAFWQAAKNPKHPCHKLFPWDKTKAAEKWWDQRAREILGAYTYEVETKEYIIDAPVLVRDTSVGGQQGYRAVTHLHRDPERARESLIFTLETAAGHLRRAMDLAVPLGFAKQIDRLIFQITGLERAVKGKKAA